MVARSASEPPKNGPSVRQEIATAPALSYCLAISPGSAFGRMARTGSLADVSLGRGIHPTWFSRFPFMGLPIDHVLVNPGFRAAEVEVLPSIGSDHFPLLASLAFAPKATQ